MNNNSDISNLTEKYFIQQAELYGRDFYLEVENKFPPDTKEAQKLEEFYQQIKNCQKCKLSKSRTKFVFGTGNPKAELMCIGEAPGYDEDRQGEPFVGSAGHLLNRILAAIGFQREEVYIANIVKCHPSGNRDPEAEEIAQCFPYLKSQIAMIKPKVILALGRVAAQNLLNTHESLGSLRNLIHQIEGIKVIVTYHPAALLRNPQWKRGAWEDVQRLRNLYDEVVGDKPPFDGTQNKSR
ncbi:MAG: uracil-DNA glycosylase family protein [bacterium]